MYFHDRKGIAFIASCKLTLVCVSPRDSESLQRSGTVLVQKVDQCPFVIRLKARNSAIEQRRFLLHACVICSSVAEP